MHLEMRYEPTGHVRPIWYGRFIIDGKKECVNLGVKLAGAPPASRKLKDKGDEEFEESRWKAKAKLEQVAAEAQSKRDADRLVHNLIRMKTGVEVREVKLVELKAEWEKLPRRRPLATKFKKEGGRILERFVLFVQGRNRRAVDLVHVDETAAMAFMQAETERKVSARTWNGSLKLLRSAFRHLLPNGAPDPFAKLVTREEETIFRKPFTPVELRAILDEAKDDELIRPILVTGMCTAMRRGDCCRLQWKDVDLDRNFVTVKTAKTGGTVSIPIFGLFRDELVKAAKKRDEAKRNGNGSAFVFPEAAKMYGENPYGITARVKKVLWGALSKLAKAEAAARGEAPSGAANGADAPKELASVPVEEVRRRGKAYLATLLASERRESMGKVFGEYVGGASVAKVAKSVGVSQSTVSLYLNEIEGQVKCKVVRRAGGVAEAVKDDKSLLRAERANGVRRASVRDFHSLRVTWVTLALTAGVPLELVQRVTGHKTTDVVLKHYFRPGQEDFRLALEGAMPKLLTMGNAEREPKKAQVGEGKSPKQEMRELLDKVKPKALREQLLGLLGKL
jgi:integrase